MIDLKGQIEALQAEERRVVTRLRELQLEREAAERAVLRAVAAMLRGQRYGSNGHGKKTVHRIPETGLHSKGKEARSEGKGPMHTPHRSTPRFVKNATPRTHYTHAACHTTTHVYHAMA